MSTPESNTVKTAIAQRGNVICEIGSHMTVVNLRVNDEVVARFKVATGETPAGDFLIGTANDGTPCFFVVSLAMLKFLRA